MFNLVVFVLIINSCLALKCDKEFPFTYRIENDGFHRLFDTVLHVSESINANLNNMCYLAVHHTLPNGLFVDPEQLNELTNCKKQPQNLYYINETIDIEANANISSLINVFVLYNTKSHQNESTLKFSLPMHVRYHLPQYHELYNTIAISNAALLIRCKSEKQLHIMFEDKGCLERVKYSLPCDAFTFGVNEQCDDWHKVLIDNVSVMPGANTTNEVLSLTVPVGNLNHMFMVQLITLAVTNLSAVYILYYLFSTVKYSSNYKNK